MKLYIATALLLIGVIGYAKLAPHNELTPRTQHIAGQSLFPDGTVKASFTKIRTFKADGSVAMLETFTDAASGETKQYRAVYDVKSRVISAIDEDMKVMMQRPMPEDMVHNLHMPVEKCYLELDKQGGKVIDQRTRRYDRGGTVRVHTYRPELACADSAIIVTDALGNVVYEAAETDYRTGAVDKLFEIPNYERLDRTGLLKRQQEVYGRTMFCERTEPEMFERALELDKNKPVIQ